MCHVGGEPAEAEQRALAEAVDARTDDARNLSYEVGVNAFYGGENPFGKMLTGTEVRKVTLADVKKRRADLISSSNTRILLAGDLPASVVKEALDETIGRWLGSGWALPEDTAPIPKATSARLLFVDNPGAAQTMIRVLTPAVAVSDPRALDYGVLGTILGGTFTSRLNNNLREDKGYTYGAGASYDFDRKFGFLNTRTSVEAAVTGRAITEIRREFAEIEKGVLPQEAAKATQTRLNAILDAFSSHESVVQIHTDLLSVGQGQIDLLASYSRLRKLKPADLTAIAPNAVDEDHAVWVLVGDRETVLPQLSGLGLPDPEFFTVPK